MTTTLPPAGEAMEYRQPRCPHGWVDTSQCESCATESERDRLRDLVAAQAVEIERKTQLLRQALEVLGAETIALVPNGNGVSPIIRREVLAAISAITKELTP